jgi:NADPH:quinone reductase-like Zn-dependent oxidoreductase
MRAALLERFGTPLAIRDLSLEEPHAGEVLVKVEAAGVCHSDQHYLAGDLRCPLSVVPGHDGAGVVEAVGPGVTRFTVGDRVCLMWRPRCGRCPYCLAGRPALCEAAGVQASSGGLLDGTTRLTADGARVHHLLGVSCFAEYCVTGLPAYVTAKARNRGPDPDPGPGARAGPDPGQLRHPGWVLTERQLSQWVTPEILAKVGQAQSPPGNVTPADVARLVLWLAAGDSAMCTGQNWIVDGGWM